MIVCNILPWLYLTTSSIYKIFRLCRYRCQSQNSSSCNSSLMNLRITHIYLSVSRCYSDTTKIIYFFSIQKEKKKGAQKNIRTIKTWERRTNGVNDTKLYASGQAFGRRNKLTSAYSTFFVSVTYSRRTDRQNIIKSVMPRCYLAFETWVFMSRRLILYLQCSPSRRTTKLAILLVAWKCWRYPLVIYSMRCTGMGSKVLSMRVCIGIVL